MHKILRARPEFSDDVDQEVMAELADIWAIRSLQKPIGTYTPPVQWYAKDDLLRIFTIEEVSDEKDAS